MTGTKLDSSLRAQVGRLPVPTVNSRGNFRDSMTNALFAEISNGAVDPVQFPYDSALSLLLFAQDTPVIIEAVSRVETGFVQAVDQAGDPIAATYAPTSEQGVVSQGYITDDFTGFVPAVAVVGQDSAQVGTAGTAANTKGTPAILSVINPYTAGTLLVNNAGAPGAAATTFVDSWLRFHSRSGADDGLPAWNPTDETNDAPELAIILDVADYTAAIAAAGNVVALGANNVGLPANTTFRVVGLYSVIQA